MPGLWDYIRSLGQPEQPLVMRRGLIPEREVIPGRLTPRYVPMNPAEFARQGTRRANLPVVRPDEYADPATRAREGAAADRAAYDSRERAAHQAAVEAGGPERPLSDQEDHRVEKNLKVEQADREREKAYQDLMKHLGGK